MITSKEAFESLIRRFDKDRTIFDKSVKWPYDDKKRNKQREVAISRFPIDTIRHMTINQYALGQKNEAGKTDDSNFSYMLEYGTDTLGHITGPAPKCGIYYDKTGELRYPNKYSNYQSAFEAILKQIQKTIDAGHNFINDHDVQKLSKIIDDREPFDIHINVRVKILVVYFSNTFLGIISRRHIKNMIDYFEIPRKHLGGKLIQKQFKLIEQKNIHPIMKDWSVEDYSHFLWHTLCVKTTIKNGDGSDDTSSRELLLPRENDLEERKKRIQKNLLIDSDIIDRIIASLCAGKHVLLTGQVGTGKTDLAQTIPKVIWGYNAEVHTATSDWSTQDVIGGIIPKIEKGQVIYRIQKGCVASTVSKNWKDKAVVSGRENSRTDHRTDNIHSDERVWLVIDEFNRANIDRAFGQLFTALEYGEIKMPTESDDSSKSDFQTLVIPKDYRIIGTLNTHDRHFLFHLSDALKRRFDFIEVKPPTRKLAGEEICMMRKKAADSTSLLDEIRKLTESKEKTDEKLYEIMSFIRETKQLGTAFLISILKDMLIYHKMGKGWDTSLDSALTKKIIPQIEDLQVPALRAIMHFVNGDMTNFFVNFPHDGHFEKVEDYVKELKKYKSYRFKRFSKEFTKDWISEFKQNDLFKISKTQNRTQEQIDDYKSCVKDLRPWNEELKMPMLSHFTESIKSIIREKESVAVNALEPNFD